MSTPANEDVAASLAAAGLSLTLGTNLFLGVPQQVQTGVPSRAVFCQLYGGYGAPQRYLQGPTPGSSGLQAREPRVIIHVRTNPRDYQDGQTLTRAVYDAIHDQPPAGYDAGRFEDAEPSYMYQTENGEYVFILNYHLWIDS